MTTKEAIQRVNAFFPAIATKPDAPASGGVGAALRCEKYVSQTELLELLEWIAVIVGKTHRVEITWEFANVHKGEKYYTLRAVVLSECVLSSDSSSRKGKRKLTRAKLRPSPLRSPPFPSTTAGASCPSRQK